MNQYEAARNHAITWLEHSIECHEAGDYLSVADGYDEYDRMLSREGMGNDDPLIVALEFWDRWIDTAEHGWKFYPGFGKDDWPALARVLLENLKASRRVSDTVLLENFTPKPRRAKPSIMERLKRQIKPE